MGASYTTPSFLFLFVVAHERGSYERVRTDVRHEKDYNHVGRDERAAAAWHECVCDNHDALRKHKRSEQVKPSTLEGGVHSVQCVWLIGRIFFKRLKALTEMAACALLLYGLPKYFQEMSYPSIIEHVLRHVRVPVDVFVHTYDLRITTNPRNSELQCALDPMEVFAATPVKWRIDTQDIIDAQLKPLFETLCAHGDAWSNEFISLRNALRQYHSIDCAHSLMEAHVHTEKGGRPYEMIIASRMDMLYVDDLDVEALMQGTPGLNDIYLPDFHEFGGVNDRFAIGGPDAMRAYCSARLEWTTAFCKARARPMHSESFLAWRLERSDDRVCVRKMRFRLRRIRANGRVQDAELVK